MFILFLTFCVSGLDPHLSLEEIRKLQQTVEIELFGEWKLRKLSSSILNKTFTAINNCDITQIEFIENNTYLLNISYTAADSSELSYHIFKGKFNLVFKDSDAEAIIERFVFMGQNYEPISIVPT